MTQFLNVRAGRMISQANQDVCGSVEALNLAGAANPVASPERTVRGADKASPRLSRTVKPVSKPRRIAEEQALEARVERRRRLAAQARVENPARTEEEIEARLEQFGA
jgi:hypothetical protein